MALILISTEVYSQDIPQDLVRLMKLEGRWQSNSIMIMGQDTFSVMYFMDFKKSAAGYGMYVDEWFDSQELGSLRGINVIGYNEHDEKIHWFTVDNFGTTHNHIGTWKSPNHFYMEARENKGAQEFFETIDMIKMDNNSFEISLVAVLDGALLYKAQGIFYRQSN